MFDAEIVRSTLFGRLGWQEFAPVTLPDGSAVALSDENKASRSGRYFQDFHQAVTLRNIHSIIEVDNANSDTFNAYLTNLQNAAILNSVSAVFNEDTLIEQSLVFNGRSDKCETVQRVATKHGYKIVLARDPSYCSVIRSVSLLFAEAGDIHLVLAHSDYGELLTKDVTVEANVEKVVPIDLSLFYSCDKYKGGFFYVYFDSDLLPVEFYVPEFCKTRMFRAEPFEGDDLNEVGITSRTYGLNMEICAYRDFTQVIQNSQHLFDTLVGLQLAATVVELAVNSTRSNLSQRFNKDAATMLYNDLNQMFPSPEFPYSTGLRGQLAREIKRVKQNLLPKQKGLTITPCFT